MYSGSGCESVECSSVVECVGFGSERCMTQDFVTLGM
ncbi:hypothetical protein KC19_2G107700 [Ceratodon purpureus]|uniref:Uncharacterized protein n=1 Tax=Ceratodon purpureus TaxID=3225 RepID=A0A8T0IU46_CERPU|nr:hypothetical protein KC19_2G107700 [Ceratodon purpureus]